MYTKNTSVNEFFTKPEATALFNSKHYPYIAYPGMALRSKGFRVYLVASEARPYTKSGGLGDYVGELGHALADLSPDIHVNIITPRHKQADKYLDSLNPAKEEYKKAFSDRMQGKLLESPFWQETAFAKEVHNHPELYDIRDENDPKNLTYRFLRTENLDHFGNDDRLYTEKDNVRYMLYDKLVAAFIKHREDLGNYPNIVHYNDWQCGFIPLFDSLMHDGVIRPSLYTVHNTYSTQVTQEDFYQYSGIPFGAGQQYEELFNPLAQLGLHVNNSFNFLSGIKFSDTVTTVSPSYRLRLMDELSSIKDTLRYLDQQARFGAILNGFQGEYDLINSPVSKEFNITEISTKQELAKIKAESKKRLLAKYALKKDPQAVLIPFTSRWDEQKDYKAVVTAMRRVMTENDHVYFAATGKLSGFKVKGDEYAQAAAQAFEALHRDFPGRVLLAEYDESLAIEVSYAADWGVMPSWYEPGGITQLNWKGAGTPTIVHDVDGLHDTMHDGVDGFTVPSQPGKNQRIDQEKFYQTIREAAELSLTEPEEALNMQFSAYQDRVNYFWSRVAKETLKQYERILARRQYDAVFRPELDVYKYNGTQPVQSQFCRAVVDQNWFPKIPN